jgi:isoamylase/glycogen operon protein
LGIIERISHLKELGVNAIELMPIFEFDETHCRDLNPQTGEQLCNYWGYQPLYFFAPMRRYASRGDQAAQEFREMVRALHKEGIEVILDVVYNHTGEGKERDYVVSFRGAYDSGYYMIDESNQYRNFSGCYNTLNPQHPVTEALLLDSMRYWVSEMHIDGFRFDLTSILTRGLQGEVLSHPPILEKMRTDPILSTVKLIAEPWDAAGLYQVGQFHQWGPWAEWNGAFRDHARRFLKGDNNEAPKFANGLCGSENLYKGSRSPTSSINFITAHDGFTLRDLVSYYEKHNLANGENNRDGSDQNDSWNWGVEGETTDPKILKLRERQMRNLLLTLFISQGVPMLFMGDEYGHTRNGNNNPYVQDNELNWFLWDVCEKNREIKEFVSALIAFRKKNSLLRHSRFLEDKDVDWHGTEPFCPNWSSRFIAYTLKPSLYIAFNSDSNSVSLSLPPGNWHQVVNTDLSWKDHCLNKPGPALPNKLELAPYSALLAVSV